MPRRIHKREFAHTLVRWPQLVFVFAFLLTQFACLAWYHHTKDVYQTYVRFSVGAVELIGHSKIMRLLLSEPFISDLSSKASLGKKSGVREFRSSYSATVNKGYDYNLRFNTHSDTGAKAVLSSIESSLSEAFQATSENRQRDIIKTRSEMEKNTAVIDELKSIRSFLIADVEKVNKEPNLSPEFDFQMKLHFKIGSKDIISNRLLKEYIQSDEFLGEVFLNGENNPSSIKDLKENQFFFVIKQPYEFVITLRTKTPDGALVSKSIIERLLKDKINSRLEVLEERRDVLLSELKTERNKKKYYRRISSYLSKKMQLILSDDTATSNAENVDQLSPAASNDIIELMFANAELIDDVLRNIQASINYKTRQIADIDRIFSAFDDGDGKHVYVNKSASSVRSNAGSSKYSDLSERLRAGDQSAIKSLGISLISGEMSEVRSRQSRLEKSLQLLLKNEERYSNGEGAFSYIFQPQIEKVKPSLSKSIIMSSVLGVLIGVLAVSVLFVIEGRLQLTEGKQIN